MDDLGYLADPADKLGMLDAQAMRAARVIVDIGMHLELEIPRDNPFGFHPGERWTPRAGLGVHARALPRARREPALRAQPLPRLAGPGPVVQGGRAHLAAGPRRRQGPQGCRRSTCKQFHGDALNLGALGLDPLRKALDRL